jgi:phage-related minor tail protein
LLYEKWDEYDQKRIEAEKQKWDTVQSIASQGTDVIGDQMYNAMTGENVNIERAFKQLLARMVADFISSGLLSLLMRALNPASAGIGLFGMLIPGFASGGYTGRGRKYDIAGIVHKNEFVASEQLTSHPVHGQTIAYLDTVQRQLRGFAEGGYTSGINATMGHSIGVSKEINDIYIRFDGGVTQILDYEMRKTGTPKNNRRINN